VPTTCCAARASLSPDGSGRRDVRSSVRNGWKADIPVSVIPAKAGIPLSSCSHGLTRLVHLEQAPSIYDAIAREKAMKKWNRAWKIALVEQANPDWLDLFETINA